MVSVQIYVRNDSSVTQVILNLLLQLKAKGETSNGKPEAAEELKEAIFLAEDTHPGICDSLVAELVQRIQR